MKVLVENADSTGLEWKQSGRPFKFDQQVYIERGRYCRRHGKVVGYPPLHSGFVFVRLYSAKGEITRRVDIIPISHARAVVEHHEPEDAPSV